MKEEHMVAGIAAIILFGFMAYLLPSLLNNAYAYNKPLVIGLGLTVLCFFIAFLVKELEDNVGG